MLSQRDLVFRPDIGHKLYHYHEDAFQIKSFNCRFLSTDKFTEYVLLLLESCSSMSR